MWFTFRSYKKYIKIDLVKIEYKNVPMQVQKHGKIRDEKAAWLYNIKNISSSNLQMYS